MTYNTPMRTLVMSFFEKNAEHAYSLEEICQALIPDGHGKSTVYRLVSRLVNVGCVKRIADERSRHVTYQFVGDHGCSEHLHLKCKDCGKLIHLDSELSHVLEDTLKKTRGFELDEGALLVGRCKDCGGAV